MKRFFLMSAVLILAIIIHVPLIAQDNSDTGNSPVEIFQRVESSFFQLNDGRNESAGIYLAGAKSKKFIYLLGLNTLAVGIETKMRYTNLAGKDKEAEAEEFGADEGLGIAIYKIKSSTKNLLPVTRHPDIEAGLQSALWTVGPANARGALISVQGGALSADKKHFNIDAELGSDYAGKAIFDNAGMVLGVVADKNEDGSYRAVAVTPIIDLAVSAFAGLDLYPIWREVYPTQFAIEKVRASTALLDTEKPGAGFFIGRDKNESGYILTANHVVESDPEFFSISFSDHLQEDILGKVMGETQNVDLDLAIVKVENSPPVRPVTFWTVADLKRLEKVFAPQTVANVGYSAEYDEENNFFQYKSGSITKVTDKTIETDLPLQSGDSGGPLFNENAEIVGINLKTELSEESADSLSIASNVRTLLEYLDKNTKSIEFTEKWQFLEKPTFWKKNRSWIIPVTAASAVGAGVFIATGGQTPPPDLSGIDAVGFPAIGN